jgi:hypothetical protein
MVDPLSIFAASAVALYAAHHVGDYWVQTDHQARHKGDAGHAGRMQCVNHVLSYIATQTVFLALAFTVTDVTLPIGQVVAALAVSGVTHYLADRREHGIMFWLARRLPGKAAFLVLGVPRDARVIEAWFDCASCRGRGRGGQAADASTGGLCWDCRGGGKLPSALTISDNPSLGTGAWALDQSWHIFLGVFVPALILAV